jgi:hypothetical protein
MVVHAVVCVDAKACRSCCSRLDSVPCFCEGLQGLLPSSVSVFLYTILIYFLHVLLSLNEQVVGSFYDLVVLYKACDYFKRQCWLSYWYPLLG